MKRTYRGRVLCFMLSFVLFLSMGLTAMASNVQQEKAQTGNQEKELTEEEKKLQEELKKVYEMPVESNTWEGWPKGPGTYGESAIVMEVSTGTVLYAKNIDAKQYPASITKVLTALVALENGQLTDKVTFSQDCVSFLQPGDSSVGLKKGNVITLEQALYATLLASANEAAYAVGENVGKNAGQDYDWFIGQMNAKVKQLGGVNSNFTNTNGLHDSNHYTCARDMALIGRALFKYPEFFKIVQTLEYKIPKSKTVEEHVFQQKDKMLQPQNENYYKYTTGGKTGFTSDALSTLITMAEKDGVQLVCVVLRTHGKNVYPDTTKLLKYGFKNFQKVSAATEEKSQDVKQILDGEDGYVMIPKGAAFSDMDMELTRDSNISKEATLTYSYNGNYTGTARAVLSDAYIEADSARIKPAQKEESEKKDAGQTDNKASKKDRMIVISASVLLFILVIAFIILMFRQRKKRRLRSHRRRS